MTIDSFISSNIFGSIRVLDIPLGCNVDAAKSKLNRFDVHENENCIYVDEVTIDDQPEKFQVTYGKAKNSNYIKYIRISTHTTKQKSKQIWAKFRTIFETMGLCLSIKDQTIYVLTAIGSTAVCNIEIGRQFGLGEQYPNTCPFWVRIKSDLFSDNTENNLSPTMKNLFFSRDKSLPKHNNSLWRYLILILAVILISFIAYFQAINNRYIRINEYTVFDKWSAKYIDY